MSRRYPLGMGLLLVALALACNDDLSPPGDAGAPDGAALDAGSDAALADSMLEVRGPVFDRSFVREALVDTLGDDERIARWDAICARTGGRSSNGL